VVFVPLIFLYLNETRGKHVLEREKRDRVPRFYSRGMRFIPISI
jgi:hypothetical protein